MTETRVSNELTAATPAVAVAAAVASTPTPASAPAVAPARRRGPADVRYDDLFSAFQKCVHYHDIRP